MKRQNAGETQGAWDGTSQLPSYGRFFGNADIAFHINIGALDMS